MYNPYSGLYASNTYNYGPSYRHNSALIHSNSQPNIMGNYNKSYLNLSGREIISSQYPYNNNRIALKLKNDNLLAHKQLNDLTNEYDNMKIFLNNKINQLGQQQDNQFKNLKNYFEGEKRLNIMRYEEKQNNKLLNGIKEQISDQIKKQRELENMRFRNHVDYIEKRRADINIERSKYYEDLNWYNKIQNIDRLQKNLEKRLQMNRHHHNSYNNNNQRYEIPYIYPKIDVRPPLLPPLILNTSNNPVRSQKDNELIKLFVLKEMMDDNKKNTHCRHCRHRICHHDLERFPMCDPQKIYYPTPPPVPYSQPQVQTSFIPQQQPIPIPQPIIIQSAPANPSPNIIIQADRHNDTEQLKKILATPKISKISEIKSKKPSKIVSNKSKRTVTQYYKKTKEKKNKSKTKVKTKTKTKT